MFKPDLECGSSKKNVPVRESKQQAVNTQLKTRCRTLDHDLLSHEDRVRKRPLKNVGRTLHPFFKGHTYLAEYVNMVNSGRGKYQSREQRHYGKISNDAWVENGNSV